MTAPVPAGDGIGGLCDRLEEALAWSPETPTGFDSKEVRRRAIDLILPAVEPLIAAARERDRLRAAVEGLAEELEGEAAEVSNKYTPAQIALAAPILQQERAAAEHAVYVADSLRAVVADTSGERQ